ncbi:hypothetical protein SNL152K_1636 [Streptomyces sp. NL15-2K]|nr:hypothetical protein SNL152K_1636 [Streptomyces sp. NL15-2K]
MTVRRRPERDGTAVQVRRRGGGSGGTARRHGPRVHDGCEGP